MVPLRLGPLTASSNMVTSTSRGWGLQIEYGLHWVKFWLYGSLSLFASIAFGIVWSICGDDVQGGFGVTACVMVFTIFSFDLVQSAYTPDLYNA